MLLSHPIHSGIIAKQYKEIREGIHNIVVETLFDPVALKEHFSGRKKYIQEMLHLGRLINITNLRNNPESNCDLFVPQNIILGVCLTQKQPIGSLKQR